MNDLCVILAMTAIVGSGLGAGEAGAYEFPSGRVIFADPIRAPESAADRATGPIILYSQYVRKPFMWPWASSPAQNSPTGETQRSGHGNRGGGNGGGSGSSGASGSTSGGGNMGGGSGTGSTSGGNMGGSSSGGSGSGNMK
ncbi:hypothetical protein [Rhizobium paranaense]|uniref:Uncharacterized protein n=1 Tax=Rhizobium paranaense TaxID=1650438 RepID=A0A7W9D220_9HYPH|nr:hypothetical protein [Rhizobium paranaense]MBB5574803.1 hypothetical protein [Rhizobium paranaense]